MFIDKEMVERILPFGVSHHWPVQLEVQGIGIPRNRAFRFENIWLTHLDFISNIANWWSEYLHIQGPRMFLLHKRLKHVKLRLKDWNNIEFDNIKVVANRLKPLLPTLVSGEQSGYVEGRKILNNIIQDHEVLHSLTSNKKAGMIMQLDLAKAYDKLNWTYIRRVLISFGFDHNWVRWVMALVTSSSFLILVNGSPSETFVPSRGLRKGYLLSPFLFILVIKGLGWSIKHAKEVIKIKGLQLYKNGQALNHQQFVDDTILQGIPMVKEALAYKQILSELSMAIGMEVNLSKSKIFFFNSNIANQRNISKILGFQRNVLPSKYLGVPLTSKPFLKTIWELMINKM
eukprot:PITA_32555